MQNDLDFEALAGLLRDAGAVNSPTELHGMLCGRLCGPPLEKAEWQALAVEFMGFEQDPDEQTAAALEALLAQTREQLGEQSVQFQLLLPAHDTALARRAGALSEWCHGFLSGFGASVTDTLSVEIKDALADFAAIVQIEADDEDAASAEEDFFQVADYVRGAVMSLHLALASRETAAPATVH